MDGLVANPRPDTGHLPVCEGAEVGAGGGGASLDRRWLHVRAHPAPLEMGPAVVLLGAGTHPCGRSPLGMAFVSWMMRAQGA